LRKQAQGHLAAEFNFKDSAMSQPTTLINIQILRGFAALSVAFGHSAQEATQLALRGGRAPLDTSFFNWGIGVDVFFVISGFIMVLTSADNFGQKGAPRRFLERRLARIVPLYWLLTTVLILGALLVPTLLNVPLSELRHIIASYLFIPELRANGEVRPVAALGWTLNYEMFFYVLFATSMLFPLKRGIALLTALFAAITLYGAIAQPHQTQIAFWTNSITLEFLMGVFLGLGFRAGWRLNTGPALALIFLGILGTFRFGAEREGQEFFIELIRSGLPGAAIVTGVALMPNLKPGRSVNALTLMGDASYSLYLFHPFVIRPLREIWARTPLVTLPTPVFLIACVVCVIAASVLLYLYIERPMTRGLQRAMAAHKPSSPTTEMQSVQPHAAS